MDIYIKIQDPIDTHLALHCVEQMVVQNSIEHVDSLNFNTMDGREIHVIKTRLEKEGCDRFCVNLEQK